jgi:hypothetical protein
MVSAVLPRLLSVTVWAALGMPTSVDGKTKLDADNWTCVPVPVSAMDCGLPPPLSLRDTALPRVPAAVGVKVMLIVQLAPGDTELPQVLLSVKSAGFVPVRETLVILSAVLPTLVSVTAWAALEVPTGVDGKTKLDADNFTCVPVPVSAMDCGLPASLSLMDTEAVRVPAAVGVKLMLIVQLPPPATEPPQVLLWL